jgi:adhesin transport system membrane fusion protein
MAHQRPREEDDLVPDIYQAARRTGSRFSFILSALVVVFVAAFLIWSSLASIDEVTRGEGRVVPTSRLQTVQNLDGGILLDLLVQEGDIVEKDAVLLRITNTDAASDLRDIQTQVLSLKAAVARLQAEIEGKELQFPSEVEKDAPKAAMAERTLDVARRNQLESEIAVFKNQAEQRQHEVDELRTKLVSLRRSKELITQEIGIMQPLVEKGNASRLELVRRQREMSDIAGQIENSEASIPRAASAVREMQRRVEEKQATFIAETSNELNQRRVQLASLIEKGEAGSARVTRTEVRSPVRGIVKELKVNTLGGVIKPGQDLIDIVPLEDTLIVEARLQPRDIAFLRPGLPATVKITAYDYAIYGSLHAKLERISPDATQTEKGESFFRVFLRTDKSYLGKNENDLPITPGMTATAEILTGKKTVLHYLMKPILRAKERALRER